MWRDRQRGETQRKDENVKQSVWRDRENGEAERGEESVSVWEDTHTQRGRDREGGGKRECVGRHTHRERERQRRRKKA